MLSPRPKVSARTRLNAAPRAHFPASSAAYTPHATSPTRTFTPRLRAAQTQQFNPPPCVPRGYWYFFARATSRPSSYAPKRNQQTAAKRLQDQASNCYFIVFLHCFPPCVWSICSSKQWSISSRRWSISSSVRWSKSSNRWSISSVIKSAGGFPPLTQWRKKQISSIVLLQIFAPSYGGFCPR